MTPKLNAFKKKIQLLIADNKIDDALQELLQVYEKTKGEYYDEILVLAARLKANQDKVIAGTIDDKDAEVNNNIIAHSLATIALNLDDDNAIRQYFGLEVKKPIVQKPKMAIKSLYLWIVIGVLVVVIGFLLIPKSSSPTVENQEREAVEEPIIPQPQITQDTQQKEEKIITNDTVTTNQNKAEAVEVNLPTKPVNIQEKEPNNSLFEANKVALDGQVSGSITATGEKDCFEFQTPSAYRNVLIFMVNTTSSEFTPKLNLYDKNRNYILTAQGNTGGSSIEKSFSGRPNSTYFVELTGRYGKAGDYQLTIEREPFTSGEEHEKEGNDSFEQANLLLVDKPLKAYMSDTEDLDYYQVFTGQASEYTIVLENNGSNFAPQLELFDLRRRVIKSFAKQDGANIRENLTLSSNSVYYIRVFDRQSGFGDYFLNLSAKN